VNKKDMRRVCLVFGIVGLAICSVLHTRLHWGTFGIALGFLMLITEAYGEEPTSTPDGPQ